jgi:hypothetical protein
MPARSNKVVVVAAVVVVEALAVARADKDKVV